jgi:hypothetical protein
MYVVSLIFLIGATLWTSVVTLNNYIVGRGGGSANGEKGGSASRERPSLEQGGGRGRRRGGNCADMFLITFCKLGSASEFFFFFFLTDYHIVAIIIIL